MRLTQALLFYTRYRRVPGLLRFGKNRVITPLSVSAKRKAAELMVIERQNLDILEKPYLSMAEEAAFNSTVTRVSWKPEEEREMDRYLESLEELPRHVTLEEVIGSLNIGKRWE